MRLPVTLDLHLSSFTYPDTPPEALFEKVVAIATAAEESGWSSVSFMDHLHQIPPVGPPEQEMLEGNTMLAAVAARTSKISLGLLVGGVTYRNPALLAKIATTIDVISGGRAWYGIGAAWFEEEHDAYGFRFPSLRERFEHLEDALQIARLMFTEDRPSFTGTHHSIDGILNNPKPIRGDIPILIGGSGERKTLRFVAKYADGCNLFGDVERTQHLLGVLDRHCEDVGRDPSEITRTRMGVLFIGEDDSAAEAKLDAARAAGASDRMLSGAFAGGPERVAEQVREFMAVGVEGLTLTMPDPYDLDAVRLAGETLGPVLDG